MIRLTLRLMTRARDTERVIRALKTIMLPARIERSCVRCELCADVEARGLLIYLEDWQSEQDLVRQIRSERFVQLLLLMEMAEEPPVLEFAFISETRGLEFVQAVKLQEDKT